jgi:CRISPR-associated protein Cas2
MPEQPVNEWDLYVPGITEFNPTPDTAEVKNMIYLVAYDIADHKRLRRVARTCEDFGVRVEKSVFECDLPKEVFEKLWCELVDIVVDDEDAVVVYRICRGCIRDAESIGVVPERKKRLFYCL